MTVYPNLRHARLYCACLAHGSVTRGAEQVGISQPAASQALARLGTLFGATLIDIEDGRLVPTAEGRLVQARLLRALDLIRAGCDRLRQASGGAAQGALENRLTVPHLRAISVFAETGGFSAAARLLDQSEPAVHKMGRGIEKALGVALFEGSGRGIRLSSAGTATARWARLALNEFESAAAEIGELRGSPDGLVAIGTLPLARTSLVPDAVVRVSAQYPRARFMIAEGRYDDLLHDVEMGRIDVLVGALRPSLQSQTLDQEELFAYRLRVVARPGHPLARLAAVGVAGLADYPWIVARADSPSREIFARLSQRFPVAPRQTVETGSLVAIRGLLMQTDHLALLSPHQIAYEMQAGMLRPLSFDLGEPANTIGLTTRRNWRPTALQAATIAALRDVAAAAKDD